jgi:hypothetical protein
MNVHVLLMIAYNAPYPSRSLLKGPSMSSIPVFVTGMTHISRLMMAWLIVSMIASVSLWMDGMHDPVVTRLVIFVRGNISSRQSSYISLYYSLALSISSMAVSGMQCECIGFDSNLWTAFDI